MDTIIDKSYRLPNGHWPWKIQHYIDQTNIKLCYWAEFAISISSFVQFEISADFFEWKWEFLFENFCFLGHNFIKV